MPHGVAAPTLLGKPLKKKWRIYQSTAEAIWRYLDQLDLTRPKIYPRDGFFREHIWQPDVIDYDDNPRTLGVHCTVTSTTPDVSKQLPAGKGEVLVERGSCPQWPQLGCAFFRPRGHRIDLTIYDLFELQADKNGKILNPPNRAQIFTITHAAFQALSSHVPAELAPMRVKMQLLSTSQVKPE
jgi:hypothetical protein